MSHRSLASIALALAAPVAICAQTPAAASAKTQPTAAKTAAQAAKAFNPPKDPYGHPDLQGYWTNNTTTPLERPKELGSKEFYTEAELTELQKKEKNRLAANEEEGRPTQPGTDDDVHYDFSQFALDRGQSKLSWNLRTSIIVGDTGRIPQMLPAARQRQSAVAAKNKGHEFDGPENRPLSARCILMTQESVPMLAGGYNNNLQIIQGANSVAILHEMDHSFRIIPTDGSLHPAASIKEWKGDSRGHWEGNTLVIDTTNFDERNSFRGSGPKLHVVERFTPVDKDTIIYRFTIEDPDTWDQPWTGETAWSRIEGPIYEFACHEGNYGLRNTLRGARVAEEEAAAKPAR